MANRLRAIARALRRDDTRFVTTCTRALRGLEGDGAVPAQLFPMGARFVARGTLTARMLSVGRDRPWPYAFARQIDPADPGYLPRSMLPLHLNLSYRNWTALSLPGRDEVAWVDPAGWLTPAVDGPSIAVWVGDSRTVYTLEPLPGWGEDPGALPVQRRLGDGPFVRTTAVRGEVEVEVDAWPAVVDRHVVFGLTARVRLRAPAPRPVRVGFAFRPANPEGVAPVFQCERRDDGWWFLDGRPFAFLPHAGSEHRLSNWHDGDVYGMVGGALRGGRSARQARAGGAAVTCEAGFAHGCELYRVNLSPGETFKRTLYACAVEAAGGVLRRSSATRLFAGVQADWRGITRAGARVELPVADATFRAARTTLLAMTDSRDVARNTRGVSYHDAAAHLGALTRLGFGRRAADVLRTFPRRQERSGGWRSHGGEQDGTGPAIFAIADHVRLTGDDTLTTQLWPAVRKGARWILDTVEDGMMPAGWSAAHLGPADRYHWDALWSCAGLREAAWLARRAGDADSERAFTVAHGEWLDRLRARFGEGPVPAASGRHMDSAAASVLCAVWPLGMLSATEPCMRETVAWLLRSCMHDAGLFHDVVHSGVNGALTGLLAETRLQAGDPGAVSHLDYLAAQAWPTGVWPEAFHPLRGGVMGDGDHPWAAAEFAMLCRNLVLWEDGATLHLFRGADRRWWDGPTVLEGLPTAFGRVNLETEPGRLRLDAVWRRRPARVVWHTPEGVTGRMRVNGEPVEGPGPRIELRYA
ncbi:MAG: hypothetical protein H6739_28535 [Alphaproteobacteria bacterium]|nr:hypothetical protein [Alphaproteobacteria bacterium]